MALRDSYTWFRAASGSLRYRNVEGSIYWFAKEKDLSEVRRSLSFTELGSSSSLEVDFY